MEHVKGLRTYIAPNDTLCAGLGLFDHSRGAKSLHLKKEHVAEAHPLLTRTSESQLHIRFRSYFFSVAANIYKKIRSETIPLDTT